MSARDWQDQRSKLLLDGNPIGPVSDVEKSPFEWLPIGWFPEAAESLFQKTTSEFRMEWENGEYQIFDADIVTRNVSLAAEASVDLENVRNVRYGSIYDREGSD